MFTHLCANMHVSTSHSHITHVRYWNVIPTHIWISKSIPAKTSVEILQHMGMERFVSV